MITLSKKLLILIFILAMTGGFLIGIILYPTFQAANTKNLPSLASFPRTTFYLGNSPEASSSAVNVYINTRENQVTSVKLNISYDPKTITNVDITQGDFLPNPTVVGKSIDNIKGTVSYQLSLPSGAKAVRSKGVVAKISYQKNASASGNRIKLSFQKGTVVYGLGRNSSLLWRGYGLNLDLTATSSSQLK